MILVRSSAKRLAALLAAVALAACGMPVDPDGTLDRVRGGTLRVGVSPNPPWTDLPAGGDGPPEGVEVDLVRGFAEHVDADVSWTAGGEEELMGELDAGRLDLVVGGLSATSPWSTHAALTRPWTTAPGPDGAPVDHVVATRMGENDLLVELETYLDTAGAP